MLPAAHRLTDGDLFRRVSRRGRRAAATTVVVHVLPADPESPRASRVGFVVSKAVGNAVVRNRVRRRLRHAAAEQASSWASGELVVVRALPAAATASYADLGADLASCLRRAVRAVPAGASP